VLIAPTGGWTNYREFSAPAPLAIPAGRHVVTIAFEGVERMNFDWLSLATYVPTTTPTPTPTATSTVTPTVTAPPSSEYSLSITGLDLVNEWVSIRNTGGAAVNLRGCTLSNAGSFNVYTFPSFELGAGATVTVHSVGGTNTGTDLYWGVGPLVWNDYRDTATLRQPNGAVISALTRDWWP
ncbi:MAG: lamin tail domain-containing protein, partial [Methanospirillum sp.]